MTIKKIRNTIQLFCGDYAAGAHLPEIACKKKIFAVEANNPGTDRLLLWLFENSMKKAFTLIELLIVIVIIAILASMLLPVLQKIRERALQTKCIGQLDQLGKGVQLYLHDFKSYPKANGALFLALLYQTKELPEWQVYICPSTTDTNESGRLLEYGQIQEGDVNNACSYMGRKNRLGQSYPAIWTTNNASTTPIAGDDWDQPDTNSNHDEIFNLLFLDSHTENIRRTDPTFDDMRDPLTN